jgi:multiple sugar transport system permease protein
MFLWKELYTPTEFGMLNQVILSVNALSPTMATIIKLLLLFMWITLIVMLFILPKKVEEMARPMKLFMWIVGTVFIIATALPLIHDPSSAGSIVGAFHMTPLRWIQSPELVMLCVVIPSIWAGTGPGCLLYLAALKTIPSDLYEAADIDGATLWHKVFYITLPRLKFLIGIQFIAAVVAAFKGGTDFILALTGGGPNNASMILALEIFIRTFGNLSFGLGAAMAWILGAALIGLTAYQLKMLARAEFGSGESR